MRTEVPHFSSLQTFQLLYNSVSDPVFLLSNNPPRLLAQNTAFTTSVQSLNNISLSNTASLFSILAEKEDELRAQIEILLPNHSFQPAEITLIKVELKQEKVSLGIIKVKTIPQQTSQELTLLQERNDALLKEVLHRVKNNLNLILSLLSLQINRVQEPLARHLLTESRSRIATLSLLQQRIHNSASPSSEIRADEYLQQLGNAVLSTFARPPLQVKLQTNLGKHCLPIDILTPLGLITHELLANAVLHAFPEQEKGTIQLDLWKEGTNRFHYNLSDNGQGLPPDQAFEQMNSLGAQLVVMLSRQLKAEYSCKSTEGKGASFHLQFEV